jgi:predicted amidohydrolase
MHPFKIAAAQVASVAGDIDANMEIHAAAIATAARNGVSVLVFPELSLTGYELDLAAGLAIAPTDPKLSSLTDLARRHDIAVAVGAPLRNGRQKPKIGAIVATAQCVLAYEKMHLSGSELAFFSSGGQPLVLESRGHRVGVAICADSSHATHPQTYAELGAGIYATSVFLNADWYDSDVPRLAGYAVRFGLLTVMANHAASKGSYESVGKSTVWTPKGAVLVQASGLENALLIATSEDGLWRGQRVLL